MSGFELRIVLVGWGAIGARVGHLLAARNAPVRIVAVALRDPAKPRPDLPEGTAILSDPSALTSISADMVVEAAGRASVAPWGRAALMTGMDFAASSTSAFADDALFHEFRRLAQTSGARLIIPPGALGGIDALAAASRLPLSTVRHEIIKPPVAWRGTAAEALCTLSDLKSAVTFFEGPAREAAARFPQNANVAVISALAGVGLDRTTVALTADPSAQLNRHSILAEGEFGRMAITLENRPAATNPKSSEMTALSLVRMIENRAGGLVI